MCHFQVVTIQAYINFDAFKAVVQRIEQGSIMQVIIVGV